LDSLVCNDTLAELKDVVMDNINTLKKWEVRAKELIKEINTRYHNYSQCDSLYKLVENELAKIESLKDQA